MRMVGCMQQGCNTQPRRITYFLKWSGTTNFSKRSGAFMAASFTQDTLFDGRAESTDLLSQNGWAVVHSLHFQHKLFSLYN